MQFTVACKSCGKKLKATEQHVGKKAKCSNCGNVVVIQAPVKAADPQPAPSNNETDFMSSYVEPPQVPPPAVFTSVPPGPPPVQVISVQSPSLPRSVHRRPGVAMAGVAVLCLVVGYFAGREHLKYQMSNALETVREQFSKGIAKAFSPPDPKAAPPNLASDAASPDVPAIPEVLIEQPYRTEQIEITLTKAQVGIVPLKNTIGGDTTTSAEPALALSFSVRNPHDRKILTFSGESTFSQKFKLYDDVDNYSGDRSYGAS
jgi:hypothetical protein